MLLWTKRSVLGKSIVRIGSERHREQQGNATSRCYQKNLFSNHVTLANLLGMNYFFYIRKNEGNNVSNENVITHTMWFKLKWTRWNGLSLSGNEMSKFSLLIKIKSAICVISIISGQKFNTLFIFRQLDIDHILIYLFNCYA